MNTCEYDLLNSYQQYYKRLIYNFGSTIGIIDMGNIRKRQEDSILISKHKLYPNNEILLIADGMGGLKNGALASRIAAAESLNWFQSLNFELWDINKLKRIYGEFISSLDRKIRSECGGGGTTMVTAIFLEDGVLIANIGDSRAYTYSDNKLKQITIDHSITQNLLNDGIIHNKEDMRFHKDNNLILSRLGCEKKLLTLDFYEIDIKNFEELFLFSDGITDCISDKRLNDIICKTSFCQVAYKIMDEVLTTNTYSTLNSEYYFNMIPAGKDNLSVISKIKRR